MNCTFCGEYLGSENTYNPGMMVINLREGVRITLCNECRKALHARECKYVAGELLAISSLVRYGPCEHSDLVSWFTERCPGIDTQTAYYAFEDYCKKKRSETE